MKFPWGRARVGADEIPARAKRIFAARWYLQRNPDVVAAGEDAFDHYSKQGWKDRRNPHPMFDVAYYLGKYRDVAAAEVDPLVHYIEYGWREGRNPHPLFDTTQYLEQYGAAIGPLDPLTHYICYGRERGFSPGAKYLPPEKPVIFMADVRLPRRDRDSGSLDQISFLKIFRALGFDIHFLGTRDQSPDVRALAKEFPPDSNGVRWLRAGDFHCVDDYLFRYESRIAAAFLSRHWVAESLLPSVRELCPQAKIIFNTVDLHFIREKREGEILNEPELISRSMLSRQSELDLVRRADASIVVSEYERAALSSMGEDRQLYTVPLIREFGTAPVPEFSSRNGIAFVGGFSHRPNVDAVEHFLAAVWPELHARRPDIPFFVVGSSLPAELASRRDPGVRFVGHVEHIDHFLDGVKLTVAPLRFGAGAKGKVVLSLGRGVPCVASEIAAEGMGLQDGREIAVARSPADYVEKICSLYDDKAAWTQRSSNGLRRARSVFSLDNGIRLTRDILQDIGVPLPLPVLANPGGMADTAQIESPTIPA
jgi:glycosyltransferase involved in cell wall biosynthesis